VNVYARASFDRALKKLPNDSQELVLATARRLPDVFGRPHQHSGMSVRRIGDFYEFRVGLQWRVVFLLSKGDAILLTVGNHDEVARFVRENS
jgi:mRNA-degrading endonuclease RelE of RelBE toxin-antitoxin system